MSMPLHINVSLVVPSPNVEVTVPQSEPYLSGMFAELRCSISLDDAINSQTDVEVIWLKDGIQVDQTSRVQTLSAHLIGGSQYDALLQYNTLSSSSDSGDYVCVGTVFPTDSNYITNVTGMALFSFSVTGTLHSVKNSYNDVFLCNGRSNLDCNGDTDAVHWQRY